MVFLALGHHKFFGKLQLFAGHKVSRKLPTFGKVPVSPSLYFVSNIPLEFLPKSCFSPMSPVRCDTLVAAGDGLSRSNTTSYILSYDR